MTEPPAAGAAGAASGPAWQRACAHRGVALALILLVGLGVYGQSLGFGLTQHDDGALIGYARSSAIDPASWIEVFVSDPFARMAAGAGGLYYRPLLFQSLMLDALMGGDDPRVYHASNVAYHLIATSLLLILLLRLGQARTTALFLALAFLLHPALTQAVAWIPGRNDSLLGIFVLATLIGVQRVLERPSAGALVGTVLAWNATLYTKESGLFVAALLPFLIAPPWWRARRAPRGALLLAGLLITSTLLWLGLRWHALGDFPLFTRHVPDNLRMYVVSLGKLLVPVQLSVLPSDDDTHLAPGLLVVALLAVLLWRSRDRRPEILGLGLAWLLLGLAPSLLAPEHTRGLEHRLYVPALGLAVLLAEMNGPAGPERLARLRPVLAIGVLATLTGLTLLRLPDDRDPRHYWESAARTSPHAIELVPGLCRLETSEARWEAALPLCRRAASRSPRDPAFPVMLAKIHMQLGQPHEAEIALRKAMRSLPDSVQLWLRLADTLDAQGRKEDARHARRRARALREARSPAAR